MKTKLLAIFAAVFLFATPVLGGDLGHLTVRDWITQYSVTYNHDLVFLTGEIDALLISSPTDLMTVGAVASVLRNRLRDGIIKFDDPMWRVVNDILIDFGCKTIVGPSLRDRGPVL